MTEVRTARAEEYGALMAMLDDVFFSDDEEEAQRDFLTLLPKLYKEQYRPWERNYCVFEDGRPVAAVGMYTSEVVIAGEPVRLGGIGNVAVAKDCRRKGYMKLAMDAALEAMKAKGCDFGELGGQRQRYQYWGFERGGAAAGAHISETNLRHAFGDNILDPDWHAEPISPSDADTLAQAQALIEAQPLHVKHNPAAFYDILCSWRETPYAVRRGGALEGFFTLSRDGKYISQFLPRETDSLEMALRAAFSVLPGQPGSRGLHMTVPLWRGDLLALAERIAENVKLGDTGMYNVLSWQRMLRAMLRLQGQCRGLPDGDLTVHIRGYNGDETLRVSVVNGEPSVEPFAGEAAFTFDHLEAMRYFFAPFSVTRKNDALAQSWFPLPMELMGIDGV